MPVERHGRPTHQLYFMPAMKVGVGYSSQWPSLEQTRSYKRGATHLLQRHILEKANDTLCVTTTDALNLRQHRSPDRLAPGDHTVSESGSGALDSIIPLR